jgi:hypothetical protein
VVIIAVQNYRAIWCNLVEPNRQKLTVGQNAAVISAADHPVVTWVGLHPCGNRLLNFSDASSRRNGRPRVFTTS